MGDADAKDVVILVVGNVHEEKTGVVDCLTRSGGWTKYVTAAEVRILTHPGSGAQVVDTTPLLNVQGRSATAIARRWISRNSLRRIIFGKMVFVVSVVTNAIIEEPCNTAVFANHNCWLDVLGLILGSHRDIMILAVTEGICLSAKLRHQVENCLWRHHLTHKNVLFTSSTSDDSARKLVEVSVRKMCRTFCLSNERINERGDLVAKPITCGTPFFMGEASPAQSGRDMFGPWGPERVFLFGRTGSGKSTLAQMLTLGKLDRHAKKLRASSSIRGGTREIEHGEGRGWYVVDTPGFGEPEAKASTVTTHAAQEKVKNFVEWKEGTFSHYLFVLKKDRIDQLEVTLWKFFKLLFGERISHHFSIVISDADSSWLETNLPYLQESFEGCCSFLTAEFPPHDDDEELEVEYEDLRSGSLRMLEEELAKLGRTDLQCAFGEHSRMHRLNERNRADIDAKVGRGTSLLIDIINSLGFLSLFNSVDDAVYRLTRIGSRDNITLESLDMA
ncbi:unnamed protein product [Calypogeia fissa]